MERKTIKVSRKKLFWAVIILIIISIWLAYRGPRYGIMPMIGGGYSGVEDVSAPRILMPESSLMEKADMGMIAPDYYPYPGNPDITDTRQFLKTSYSADIKTRDVKTMIRDVRNLVRDAEGRIDNAQESEKFAYLNFVVPKSKFEAFRDEIESLTYEKLITVNVSSENLLGQKQSIEEQMNNATATLADLETQKANLIAKHNQTLSSLNSQLSGVRSQLSALRLALDNTTNEIERSNLQSQITSLTGRETSLSQSITSENNSYNSQLANLNNRIDSAKNWVAGVEKQDTQFGNNIETVNGSISINWASHWEIAKLFSPIHPAWIILILVIIAWKILGRYGYVPKIELV